MAKTPAAGEPTETLKYKTWILKVPINCEGCKRKVKKTLQNMEGVYMTTIDTKQHRVTVIGNVEADTLIKKLVLKTGKRAEIWPQNPVDDDEQEQQKSGKKKNKNKKKKKNQNENDDDDDDDDDEDHIVQSENQSNSGNTSKVISKKPEKQSSSPMAPLEKGNTGENVPGVGAAQTNASGKKKKKKKGNNKQASGGGSNLTGAGGENVGQKESPTTEKKHSMKDEQHTILQPVIINSTTSTSTTNAAAGQAEAAASMYPHPPSLAYNSSSPEFGLMNYYSTTTLYPNPPTHNSFCSIPFPQYNYWSPADHHHLPPSSSDPIFVAVHDSEYDYVDVDDDQQEESECYIM